VAVSPAGIMTHFEIEQMTEQANRILIEIDRRYALCHRPWH
jgi:hypothetical protein